MMYYVYILRCSDETLYTGITTNVERRFAEHINDKIKGAKYTRAHKPKYIESVWSCNSKSFALKLEIFIKKLSKKSKNDIIAYPDLLKSLYSQNSDCEKTELLEYVKEFRLYHLL